MSEKFHRKLTELKGEVVEMGELATGMLTDSVTALKNLDTELAEEVISRKEKLAEMDEDIEEKALTFISLYQPMAKDMRTIGCVLKMITYLARIGRYGKDIAVTVKELEGKEHIGKLVEIPYMASRAEEMIRDALQSFEKDSPIDAEKFISRDDELDSLRHSIFRECLTYMMGDPQNITRCSYYIMIARYLERCGDHACKMAEKINYMITGERAEIK